MGKKLKMKLIKEFMVENNYSDSLKEYVFKAEVFTSSPEKFRMTVICKSYDSDSILKNEMVSKTYYNDFESLKKDFEYHYVFNLKNVFTTYIRVIK